MARDYTEKVAKQAVPLLEESEVVQKAVFANPHGGFMDRLNQGDSRGDSIGGLAGAAFKAKKASEQAEGDGGVAAAVPRHKAYLAVTNQRFVIFDMTKTAKLKSVVAAFEPADLPELTSEREDRTTHSLYLGFADGSTFGYRVIQKQDADGVVAAFDRLR